jgi:putative nucleotidyltransferase with HDIG domain
MVWNINTIVPIVAIVLYSALYLLVAFSTPQTQPRKAFRLYLLAMVLWSLSAFLVLADVQRSTYWIRLMAVGGLASFITIFNFIQTFLDKRRNWVNFFFFYILVAGILTVSTRLVVVYATVEGGVVTDHPLGPLVGVLIGPGYLIGLYGMYELIRGYRETIDINRRNRLWYLIFGTGLMMSATLFNFTPLSGYPIEVAANGITALVIAYSILRYQLLDIRLVIRQGLLYSIPTVIIGSTYFLIITLSLNLFNIYSGARIFLLSLGVAVITALLAEPLRLRAQQVIDRMFFREKYDSRLMLQNLSGRVASVLDLDEITNMILHEVVSTLHIHKAAIFLRDEETGRFQLTSQVGLNQIQSLSFRLGHPVILWLSTHEQPLTKHDLEFHPQFRSMWRSERQDLDELEVELLIPLKVQNELMGIFTVGPKRSEQAYTEDDQLTLLTLANQTAVAIENARLYTSEQIRLKEMDTLYSMARRLVSTDNLDSVVRTVAQHACESVGVTYTRILTKEENGDYYCRAVYPSNNGVNKLRDGWKEPLVAEYYYNWILQHGHPIVVHNDDPDLHLEEKEALFFENATSVCLSPLSGGVDYVGLLILGDSTNNNKNPFDTPKLRLINVISDYATSAIQRAVLHDQLEDNFLQTVVSLANAMDARDSYTGDHSQRMADIATKVSRAMKLSPSDIEAVHWAAILHDIGKIGVPDEILNKKGPLNKKEWVVMKEHPVIGAQIVAPVKYLAPVSPIIRAHHERFDGKGYPYGLEGEEIPLGSRILAVVDAYVAIRDERIYSKAHTHEEAVAELRRASGTQFDPQIIDVFCKTITG